MEKERIKTGATFFDILQVAFIVLKLCRVIDWSWVWVLFPLWVPILGRFILIIIKGIIDRREK